MRAGVETLPEDLLSSGILDRGVPMDTQSGQAAAARLQPESLNLK